MFGFLNNNNVPCCSQCNVLKLSRKLDDVVVQIFRIHTYQATIDPSSLSDRERYFYDILNSPTGLDVCTWGHSTQQPVEFYINGQRLMARSAYPLWQFKLGIELVGDEGLELKSVPLPVYKEWQRNVDLDTLRRGFGVNIPVNQRIPLSAEMKVILRKLEAQAIQNDQEAANKRLTINRASHLRWKDSDGISKLLDKAYESDSSEQSYHSSDDEEDDLPDQFARARRIHVRRSKVTDTSKDDSPDQFARARRIHVIGSKVTDTSIDDLELDTRGEKKYTVNGTPYYECRVRSCNRKGNASEYHFMCAGHYNLYQRLDKSNGKGWKVLKESIDDLELDTRGEKKYTANGNLYYECRVRSCTKMAYKKCDSMCISHFKQLTKNTTEENRSDDAGCNCKKSKCLKKYCICFSAGIKCDNNKCKCTDCLNGEGVSSMEEDEDEQEVHKMN